MRVTNSSTARNYINNLNSNLEYLSKLQDQQSSGQKLRHPSDDPFGVSRTINLNDVINRNRQYAENIQDATNWINTSDDALDKISSNLLRISTQINDASNGSNSGTELYAFKAEVQECIEGIVDMVNTNYNGNYIFGGYKTGQKPLEAVRSGGEITGELTNSGDNNMIEREISPGVTASINTTVDQILGLDGSLSEDLGTTFKNIMEALTDPTKRGNLSSDDPAYSFIDKINAARDNISRLRAQVGARQNRMKAASSRNEVEIQNMTEILSKTADVDIAEISIQVNVALAAYNSSLMVGAQILQPSLISFLD
jgi:flagellar hook-associated protein 3 FlgL